jgi:hypothetical protein
MKIGIIGHGADKFTESSKQKAINIIKSILEPLKEFNKATINYYRPVFISGHSPVGGIDIWSEEIAKNLGISLDLKIPKQHTWDAEYGYKQRNLDIAKDSDILYVILVDKYPPNYKGQKFDKCYHCNSSTHIKSGACWTAKQARKLGKKVEYIIINNETT